mgnify:CR=1 FL=1
MRQINPNVNPDKYYLVDVDENEVSTRNSFDSRDEAEDYYEHLDLLSNDNGYAIWKGSNITDDFKVT